MLTFAVSQGSGFVGGPIFPSLYIGGTAGVIIHQAIHRRSRGATGTGVHLPARRRPRGARTRAVLHGADGRVPYPGGCPADRTHPDRRRHRIHGHGGREIPPGQPQASPRCRGASGLTMPIWLLACRTAFCRLERG
ncbi:MAG: hypothetical protein ACLP5E_20100 [Streptosporangiaceae bacterium]